MNIQKNPQISCINKGEKAKYLPTVLCFIEISRSFGFIPKKKMKEILLAYKIPVETVNAITML